MKTYLRILQYARPWLAFLPQYLLYTVLTIFFSIGNFTLIIPLLSVLFDKTDKVPAQAPAHLPAFKPTIDWVTQTSIISLPTYWRRTAKWGPWPLCAG